jgi:hypothetical protein
MDTALPFLIPYAVYKYLDRLENNEKIVLDNTDILPVILPRNFYKKSQRNNEVLEDILCLLKEENKLWIFGNPCSTHFLFKQVTRHGIMDLYFHKPRKNDVLVVMFDSGILDDGGRIIQLQKPPSEIFIGLN